MTLYQDLATANTALAQLQRCVSMLRSHYGESLDLQRLAQDVNRIGMDLRLLTGGNPGTSAPSVKPEVIVVPDTEYTAGFFADADDEGVGSPRNTTR